MNQYQSRFTKCNLFSGDNRISSSTCLPSLMVGKHSLIKQLLITNTFNTKLVYVNVNRFIHMQDLSYGYLLHNLVNSSKFTAVTTNHFSCSRILYAVDLKKNNLWNIVQNILEFQATLTEH